MSKKKCKERVSQCFHVNFLTVTGSITSAAVTVALRLCLSPKPDVWTKDHKGSCQKIIFETAYGDHFDFVSLTEAFRHTVLN